MQYNEDYLTTRALTSPFCQINVVFSKSTFQCANKPLNSPGHKDLLQYIRAQILQMGLLVAEIHIDIAVL